MKKTTAHGRKLAREREACRNTDMALANAVHSPVGRAVKAKDSMDSRAELAELMTSINVRVYLTPEGERDHKLLGCLALMLTLGTQIGIWTDRQSPETKKIHAALRAVIQLSADGGQWKTAQAKALHEAAQLALALFLAHEPMGEQALEFGYWLASRVRCGTARLSDVAGAEIYNQPEITT